MGGQLHFLGSCGGSAVIGGHWCSWAVMKVSGGEMVVVGRKELAMFGEHDAKQTLFVWSLHMRQSHV